MWQPNWKSLNLSSVNPVYIINYFNWKKKNLVSRELYACNTQFTGTSKTAYASQHSIIQKISYVRNDTFSIFSSAVNYNQHPHHSMCNPIMRTKDIKVQNTKGNKQIIL
jgi:hypothetical protein